MPRCSPFAFTSVAVLVTLVGLAPPARAQCGMGDVDWYATERTNVARAEELLRQGEPQKAAWLLQQTWPRMREAVPVVGSNPVIADGVRVMALAAVRSDGDLRSDLGWSSWSPAEREANVRWGIARLRMLAASLPDSAEVKTDLGEALARAPGTRDEARTILEALDGARDIASAEGYAALAMLRVEEGDVAGADVAALACERLAGADVSRCSTAGGRVTPVVTAAR